jgi:hypothetical protein
LVVAAYEAETVCVATVSAEVVGLVARPFTSVTGVPKGLASMENWTAPLTVPPGEVTFAVKVTDCPKTDGFTDEATTVVVGA